MKAITYLQLPGGVVRAPEFIGEGPGEGCWRMFGEEVWDKTPGLFSEFSACARGSRVQLASGLIKFLPPEWFPPEWMEVEGAERPPQALREPVASGAPSAAGAGPSLVLDTRSHKVTWKGVEVRPRSVAYFEFLVALARTPEVAVPPNKLGGKKGANLARHRLVTALVKAGAAGAEVEDLMQDTATGYVLNLKPEAVQFL